MKMMANTLRTRLVLISSLVLLILGFLFLNLGQSSKVSAQNALVSVPTSPWVKTATAFFRMVMADTHSQWEVKGQSWAALQVKLQGAAKTYWRSPGETGVPPSFDWSKSSNLKEVKILWPAPHRFKEADSMAVGYADQLTLPLQVTPKDPTHPVILNLDLFMGICTEICIPVQQKLTLSLPALSTAGSERGVDIIDTMKAIPKILTASQSTDYLKKIGIVQKAGKSVLAVEIIFPQGEDQHNQDLFVEAPAEFYIPLSQLIKETKSAKGMVSLYHISLSDVEDPKSLMGKPLKLTILSPQGAVEINTMVK